MLQWGRTREGAEGAHSDEWHANRARGFSGAAPVKVRKGSARNQHGAERGLLQWGRTREGAEGSVGANVTASDSSASVGPHP